MDLVLYQLANYHTYHPTNSLKTPIYSEYVSLKNRNWSSSTIKHSRFVLSECKLFSAVTYCEECFTTAHMTVQFVFVFGRQALLVFWTFLALKISQGTVSSSSVSTMQMKRCISTSTSTSSSLSRKSIDAKASAGPTLNLMTTLPVWICSTRSQQDCSISSMKNAS